MLEPSSGDFTTVEMDGIEQTLWNSNSQSLARRKGIIQICNMLYKHFSSGWKFSVPKPRLLKYFDVTLATHKSFQIEGLGLLFTSWNKSFKKIVLLRWGWVSVGLNKRAYSMESSLQSIILNIFLWKQTNCHCLVAIQTWCSRGTPAASARAWLLKANAGR